MSVTPRETAPEYPPLGAATYSLTLLFFAYVLSFVDRQILALLVGPIRDQFGITDFQYSLVQGAAFALLYTFAGLPLGRMADRHSRKWVIAVSVCFWSLATCACGMARSFTQLFIARMAVGAGEAGLSPPAYSIITDSFEPRHFGYAMAFYKVAVQVGGGLALVIGGFLIEYFTHLGPIHVPIIGVVQPWQATLISVGLPGLLLTLLLFTITEPRRKGVAVLEDGSSQLPVSTVARFLWRRKRVYLSLFLGSSMLAMAGYGSAAWYPEFLVRNYGMSKAQAGTSFGSILLSAGIIGVMVGPWIADRLAARGHSDAYVRAIMYASLLAIIPAVAAPLMGSAELTLIVLWPGVMLGAVYLGVMAASFQPITPNQMRGQTTAMYIFVTNILGMAVGTSVLAAFTDFLYQDDASLHLSIATANALFYPAAVALFAYCLAAYRTSMAEAGQWQL
ncbi:MAG: MFS transporter [Pseudomonadales bacterium]|jgi:MFS family permease|nr:MFS transporter [Pseudomonadales bacterium]MDP6473222.1 MFS transporter [Pseudomonadales bacterium]MDP6826017.1 MFS transporter [Pseudomonadales bacterium]MDP6970753.1 MFS transporter [Pseudomonadales bacterium]